MGGNQSSHKGAEASSYNKGRLTDFEFHTLLKRFHAEKGRDHVPVSEFLSVFPAVVRPAIAQLLKGLKAQQSHTAVEDSSDQGAQQAQLLSVQEVISACSLLSRGSEKDVFSAFADGFLLHAHAPAAEGPADLQAGIRLNALLSGLYVFGLFLHVPEREIFEAGPLARLKRGQSNPDLHAAAAAAGEGGSGGGATADPWDVAAVFKGSGEERSPLHFRGLCRSWLRFLKQRLEIGSVEEAGGAAAILQRVGGSEVRRLFLAWAERHVKYAATQVTSAGHRMLFGQPKGSAAGGEGSAEPSSHMQGLSGQPLAKAFKESPALGPIVKTSNGLRGGMTLGQSKILTDEKVFVIQQSSPLLQQHRWTRLYATWRNGTSFNRFVSQICKYGGPTVVAIRTRKFQVIGAVCMAPWEESQHVFFGAPSQACLFSAAPSFETYPCSGGKNLQFLNAKHQFTPKGFGFGGQMGTFRLFVDQDLKEGYCLQSCSTYASGPLLFTRPGPSQPSQEGAGGPGWGPIRSIREQLEAVGSENFQDSFEVDEIEIWGTGGEDALIAQQQALARDEMLRSERRQVDKSRFLDNEFDRQNLLGGTFKGAADARVDARMERKEIGKN
uniref:Oxidation resistance protein 1 n=1 Tax=Chromera velia CCMP2878 TaxID=1169474 RepID=A0A0G4GYY6_9ALVE|eukprot:Cvel_23977.t1-p1 / transcript=Cvel_23977.t1 / gene=Cvel_23977 / organism=Chromera_velia_CCMP2878 / gene_product=TLD domain-containing protein KIAA1609 homolog, putative / transcript_product=TLD domain-containing protein KIAA1609 homolog, putative / location=Cvel_scaffold2538:15116-20152(+) / protein_length=609 / sequence_SO=supercontig / SO=protein_coding / is_pseudo=false